MEDKIKDYLNHNQGSGFNELLFTYIDKKGIKDSELYKKGNIDRKLFSKIRCNNNYIPRRNTVIKLALSLELDEASFNKLLNSAGYSLSNSTFDLIINYCLENNIYNLDIVNNYLYTLTNAVL